ncbi:MAG: glucose-1-phosphate adenylyltransferase [Clostridiales bacterium]|nr:glucose-1-phosphate adenylyltransferase [Clostridiales bacterium]MDY4037384.1 glucose-1-phosphate adenylyltransferase [Candidatus Pseudoscilispira sp.]
MKKEVVAMLLAGGQGSRLYVLTGKVAKPAIPFGGKYRIIDFPLSNCVNSGIDTVGVLTQYQPLELNSYIGSGQPWDLDGSDGGVHILPPYVSQGDRGTWYKGTANAIYQNIGFIDLYEPDYVVILSGDHIYKMDYAKMVNRHKKSGAACTISVMEVPWDEAPRFGIMNVDEEDNIVEFEEKPPQPKSNLASMGIYCFSWHELRHYLVEDEKDTDSQNDFGKNIIPNMLRDGKKMVAYRFAGYWKDVGTLDSLWDANMDMLARNGGLDVFDSEWPIYARAPRKAPAYLGAQAVVSHSVVTQGSIIEGSVENSVVAHSVTVGKGASVRYSVVMPGAVIEDGASVEYAILGEGAHIGPGARVGAPPETAEDPSAWSIAVIGPFCRIAEGEVVAPNKMLDRGHKEVLRK